MTFETTSGTCSVGDEAIALRPRPRGILAGHLTSASFKKRLFFYTTGCVLAFAAALVAWMREDYAVTIAGGLFGVWMLHGLVSSWQAGRSVTIPYDAIEELEVVDPGPRGAGWFEVQYRADGRTRRRRIRAANENEFARGRRLLDEAGAMREIEGGGRRREG